jgi:uncharacterized protein YggE
LATVTVRGESVVPVRPDELSLRLTLTEIRQASDEAYAEVANRSAELSAVLSEHDVDESARSSSAVLVREEREYDERGRPVHRGYSATASTNVRLADPAIAASLIKHAVERTGARVDGPLWQVAPDNPARLEACRRAASSARAKAEAYAEALGVRLGALTEIAEPDPRMRPAQHSMRQASFEPLAGDGEVPIEAGDLEVYAIVDVTFALETG